MISPNALDRFPLLKHLQMMIVKVHTTILSFKSDLDIRNVF